MRTADFHKNSRIQAGCRIEGGMIMTTEERIAALEAQVEELSRALTRLENQVLVNRARIEDNIKHVEEGLEHIENAHSRMNQFNAKINENSREIEKNRKNILAILTDREAKAVSSTVDNFVESYVQVREPAVKEGPGFIETIAEASAEESAAVINAYVDGAQQLHEAPAEKEGPGFIETVAEASAAESSAVINAYIDAAQPLHESPAEKEGPGIIERMTEASAEDISEIVQAYIEGATPDTKE